MHPTEAISIIIADDHAIFRNGFKSIIENLKDTKVEFIEEACNGMELVEKTKLHHPDIVITDIKMPVMDGLEACRIIRKECPSTRVIALSQYEEQSFIIEMANAGASGYLTKYAEVDEVLRAIETVNNGFSYFNKAIPGEIPKVSAGSQSPITKVPQIEFSLQEMKVIKLLCKQMSTKQIACQLQLSSRTIEDYRQKIMERIGAKNSVGIALYAFINEIMLLAEL